MCRSSTEDIPAAALMDSPSRPTKRRAREGSGVLVVGMPKGVGAGVDAAGHAGSRDGAGASKAGHLPGARSRYFAFFCLLLFTWLFKSILDLPFVVIFFASSVLFVLCFLLLSSLLLLLNISLDDESSFNSSGCRFSPPLICVLFIYYPSLVSIARLVLYCTLAMGYRIFPRLLECVVTYL